MTNLLKQELDSGRPNVVIVGDKPAQLDVERPTSTNLVLLTVEMLEDDGDIYMGSAMKIIRYRGPTAEPGKLQMSWQGWTPYTCAAQILVSDFGVHSEP